MNKVQISQVLKHAGRKPAEQSDLVDEDEIQELEQLRLEVFGKHKHFKLFRHCKDH